MSFEMKAVAGRNSSALVAYYLRTTETGWYATTEVMKDVQFREAMGQMVESKASVMQAKVAKYGASSKAVPIEDRLACLRKRVPKPFGGDVSAKQLVQTVHKAGLSLLLDRVDARTGQAFQVQLPNASAANVELIAKAIRDLFPNNVPMMLTVHTGDKNKNLHLQGWFCDRAWDADKHDWTSPLAQFRTKAGLSEFRSRVDAVLAEHGAVWKRDPNAPKRTVFHPAKSQFMKSLSHDELLKGEFLKDIQNPKLRDCLAEEIAIARYYASQRNGAISLGSTKNIAQLLQQHNDLATRAKLANCTRPAVQANEQVEVSKRVGESLFKGDSAVRELEAELAQAKASRKLTFRSR